MLTNDLTDKEDALLVGYISTCLTIFTLCERPENDDFGLQVMTEVSPPKWHLDHNVKKVGSRNKHE